MSQGKFSNEICKYTVGSDHVYQEGILDIVVVIIERNEAGISREFYVVTA